MRPSIVARDPDLIKDILTGEFNSFRYNDMKLSQKYDPLMAINPFILRDNEWKDGRKIILPALSQSKVCIRNTLSNLIHGDAASSLLRATFMSS